MIKLVKYQKGNVFDTLTPEEKERTIDRMIWLGMQGKPADRDSLARIERSYIPSKPKPYDKSIARNTEASKLINGLSNTVGTALTGASLLTMGAWNALRLLGLGKGSALRLSTAKNALAGAKAGTAADVLDFASNPSISNAVQVLLSPGKDLTKPVAKKVITTSTIVDTGDLLERDTVPNTGLGKMIE